MNHKGESRDPSEIFEPETRPGRPFGREIAAEHPIQPLPKLRLARKHEHLPPASTDDHRSRWPHAKFTTLTRDTALLLMVAPLLRGNQSLPSP